MPRRNVSIMTSGEIFTTSLFDIAAILGLLNWHEAGGVGGRQGGSWLMVNGNTFARPTPFSIRR
jgi:hypothetical protein